jgi:hypothetical protein
MDDIVSPLRGIVDARSSLQAGIRIWLSTRRMERVYIDLEATGWSRCLGWRDAYSSGCTRSTRCSRRQVVRSCLLAPCSLCASRSPQIRIKFITNKCLRLLSTSPLYTRNVLRGRMTPGLSCFPPSSLVHALCAISHIRHQSVPSPNTLLLPAYKYRAHSLEDIAPRDTVPPC